MFFWIIALALSLIVAFIIFRPLMRADDDTVLDASAFDREVYKDQIAELDRDRASGLLDEAEAELARIEISRRLLKFADTKPANAPSEPFAKKDLAPFFGVVLCAALGLYLLVGTPALPDRPLASRIAEIENITLAQQRQGAPTARGGADITTIVQQAEAHLAENPNDGRGWEVLAPVYYRMGEYLKAQTAYSKTIELLGPTDLRHSSLGEVIVNLQEGQVTPEARSHFVRALELNPQNPSANFFLALSIAQVGDTPKAIQAFEDFARRSPADAHWLGAVRMQLAALKGVDVTEIAIETLPATNISQSSQPEAVSTLSGPTREDIEAASEMEADDRMMMIRGMVASLDAKLTDEPKNFEGWQRLLRSYMVLNEPDSAKAALQRALSVYPAETSEGQALLAMAKNLQILE